MNWAKLYAFLQKWLVITSASVISGEWGFILAGICRIFFGLEDATALIGLPLFFIIMIWGMIYLPAALRKAGMLSVEPKDLGPWFNK
jgi:hypothetical protein